MKSCRWELEPGGVERPLLRIYVARHCPACAEALRLADEVRSQFAALDLQVINLDGQENFDDVFSVPTYVLNGRVVSLGNPDPAILYSTIREVLLESKV